MTDTTKPNIEDRITAIEELLAGLVTVLDDDTQRALAEWMQLCTKRMRETGSASAAEIAAIEALVGRVAV